MITGALKSFQYIALVCISISIFKSTHPGIGERAPVSEGEANYCNMGIKCKASYDSMKSATPAIKEASSRIRAQLGLYGV